jgi:hypothetical protein
VDVDAQDAEAAIDEAWTAYRSEARPKLSMAVPIAGRAQLSLSQAGKSGACARHAGDAQWWALGSADRRSDQRHRRQARPNCE